MPVSAGTSFLIILAVALTTFATRVLPFLIFPKGKEIPEVVRYLGRVLTPAVIGMLVIYCLKGTTLSELPYGIPEGLAVLVEYRGGNDTLYVFDSSRILEILHGFITV